MRRLLLPVLIIAFALAGFIALKASRPAPPQVEVRERSWRVEAVAVAPQSAQPTLEIGRASCRERV